MSESNTFTRAKKDETNEVTNNNKIDSHSHVHTSSTHIGNRGFRYSSLTTG